MPFSNRLAMLANIRKGEGPLVVWVLLFASLSITTQLLGNTVAYALFLSTFDAQRLPYIYIGSSIVTTLLSLLSLRLSQRYSLAQLLIGQCSFILLTVIGYRIGLIFTAGRWFIFSLPIWDGVVSALIFAAFWSLVGRLFNLQQGKRLFGLFGAGQQIATLLVGAFVPVLVGRIGTINLLLMAALAGSGALVALFHITRTFPLLHDAAQEASEIGADATADPQVSSKNLLAEPYIRLIFAMYILYALGSYFVDNIFYTQLESQWTNQDQLAGFLGIFNGVVGGLSLLSQLFLAPRLLSRYGVRTVILLTPAIVLGFITFFVLIGFSTQLVLLLFWMAVSTNLFLQIADSSDNTAANLLYQPLPSALRTQTQTTVDGIIAPLATGLTGLILLWLTNFLHFNAVQLGYVLLPILSVWLLIALALGRSYPKRVQQALRQRILQGNSRFQPDRASLDVIQQNLNNPHPGAVIYALDVLEAHSPVELGHALPALLQHPASAVRLDVLARLERLGDSAALPLVSHTFQTTLDPQTRSAALRTWATLGGSEQFDDLFPYLSAVDPELRHGVMVGLLRSGELEGILAVGETLAQLVNSAVIADRIFAAGVLGESGMASFYRPLLKLLRDPTPLVQRAALLAASKLQQPKLWPVVLEGLTSRQTRSAAQKALIAGGERILPELKIALERPTLALAVRLALVRICGRMRSAPAVPLLLTHLAHPHVQARTQALLALQQCGYTADAATRAQIEQQLAAEFAHAAWLLAGVVTLQEAVTAPLLSAALTHNLRQQRDRFFLWLALLYDNATVLRVRNAFRTMQGAYREGADEQRAYALETMEVLFAKNITKNLLPLLEDLPLPQQLQRLESDFPQPALPLPERLLMILNEADSWLNPWVKAVALYTAVQSSFPETNKATLCTVANKLLADPELLLQETATWALSVLAQPDAQRENGATTMLLTIEKVMILKTVDIFAQTPDEILADIAALLKEVEAPASATIFEKGEQGDSMYIIVEGEVEALDGDRVFTRMGERQVFGEMALLDGEPRTASIRTTQPTRLLRLDQEPFYELMDDRIEIARGVIHVLLQRLRARTSDVNRLQAQLDALGQAR